MDLISREALSTRESSRTGRDTWRNPVQTTTQKVDYRLATRTHILVVTLSKLVNSSEFHLLSNMIKISLHRVSLRISFHKALYRDSEYT